MNTNHVPEHSKASPVSIPKELNRKGGQYFKSAREVMDIDRSDVEKAGSVEFTQIVKFEVGVRTLTKEHWKAYIEALGGASDVSEFTLVNERVVEGPRERNTPPGRLNGIDTRNTPNSKRPSPLPAELSHRRGE